MTFPSATGADDGACSAAMARDAKAGEAIYSASARNKVRLTTGVTMTWAPAKTASLTDLTERKFDSVIPDEGGSFLTAHPTIAKSTGLEFPANLVARRRGDRIARNCCNA